MDYPPAVIGKAQRLDQLLLRVEAGEAFAAVCAELTLAVTAADWHKWQAKHAVGGRQWAALLDSRFGHTHTINSALREWLYDSQAPRPDAACPGPGSRADRRIRCQRGGWPRQPFVAQSRPDQPARPAIQTTAVDGCAGCPSSICPHRAG